MKTPEQIENERLRPIAEAGPAPTTAARLGGANSSAEQLSGKMVCDKVRWQAHVLNSHASGDCVDPHPAEQPGKAADPRPGEVLCDKPSYKHGGSHPKKVTCVDPRPAQPQAPAEPTQKQIKKARKLAEKIFDLHNSGNADLGKETAWIEAYAEHVAAPLREERDRLACELEAMRRERNGAQSQRDQERARAEQAEARLSAAPSEAPRHCRICEEPMSDTCEECQ